MQEIHIYPHTLYNKESLYKGFDRHHPETYRNTPDYRIYRLRDFG
jgi:hypothetical protein